MSEIERFGWSGHGMSNYGPPDENSYVRFSDHDAEVTALRATVASLEQDAKRYRWLRGHCENICGLYLSWYVPEDNIEWGEDAPSLDVAVDSAMARTALAEQVRT